MGPQVYLFSANMTVRKFLLEAATRSVFVAMVTYFVLVTILRLSLRYQTICSTSNFPQGCISTRCCFAAMAQQWLSAGINMASATSLHWRRA